jgi:hypothetical protein
MCKFNTIIAAIIFICSISYSQDIVGKIYSNTEADSLYGPVLTFISIPCDQLNNLTSQTTNYLMFGILNGNLTILGDKRVVLYPESTEISQQDVSLIQKIIKEGNSSMISIELRNNGIITITNGNYTLENGVFCPPFCN